MSDYGTIPTLSLNDDKNETENMSDSSEEVETGLTDNQNRLLYFIHLHTKKTDDDSTDRWIRKQALSVLMYEGIVAKIFDYDYAPCSTLVENRRVWINISQEGQSDVEYLREEELILGLQIPSRSCKPVICYQISDKGKELLRYVSRIDKEGVNEYAYKSGSRELLKAEWDGESYWLISQSGYRKQSSITATEDVSYVASAYIPQCLRYGGRPTMSNAHRATESGAMNATDNIRDDLDEVILLNSVSIIVAEYIPFGANQIVQLNNNVGSTERVQGGFISSSMDADSTATTIETAHELTSIEILDYTLTNHINFEAEIRFAEEPGVVQVETFGISVNAEGTCFYGMQIEAVMDRIRDNISLDHLSRLLIDVQQDSSTIVDSVISPYQREILNFIFMGDASNRNKVNLIIANEITPHLTAEEYMDKGDYENELKQVIGDTKAAYDISEKDTLVFGAYGLLVCGPSSRLHEPLLCSYLQFITLDIFLQNLFSRVWIINDGLDKVNGMNDLAQMDPTILRKARNRLYDLSRGIILLDEILNYVLEALQLMEVPPEPPEQSGRSLYQRLELSGLRIQLERRAVDIKKHVFSAQRLLSIISDRVKVSSDDQLLLISETLEQNTKNFITLQASNFDTVNALRILQIIFTGMLSFDVLDRITGQWTVVDTTWMQGFVQAIIKDSALIWFLISMTVWAISAFALQQFLNILNWRSRGLTNVVVQHLFQKIDTKKLNDFLQTKVKLMEEKRYIGDRQMVTITYEETDTKVWGGIIKPCISLEYDEKNNFLFQVSFKYNQRLVKKDVVVSAENVKEKLLADLDSIFLKNDSFKGDVSSNTITSEDISK